jgi:hypothetical protein
MEQSVQNQIARLATLKLKPYKKFIKKLLKIEEQGIVLEMDYRKLRSLFQGQLMLYLDKEPVKKIAASLINIGRCVGLGNENSRLREELRTPVIEIVNVLMRDMGLGGELDEALIEELEKAEDEFFPRLFRQALKEALDNVLVNYSDYCVLNRGEYVQARDGEYIVYPFINNHPRGCKVMIGPFTAANGASDKTDDDILFALYVPRYVPMAVPQLAANLDTSEMGNFVGLYVENREMPLSLSRPLKDSCLIELEQEDCYNDYIPSFSFDDRDSAPFRRNYAEIAFALGQRAKYVFLHAHVPLEGMHLYEYIARLERIDPFAIYPGLPWELAESGDLVYL